MNKKTYILGFIALAVLAGAVWYGSQNEGVTDQSASVLGDNQEESPGSVIVSKEVVGDLVLGSPEAPVTIIKYSSHFCVHCIDFHRDTLPLLMDKYIKTGQVKLISRFVSPAEIGLAILCAREQDKFSEVSDYFFEHSQELKSADDVKSMALQIDLDQESFNQCYDSKKYEDKVVEWFDQATESGVAGTPTFFVNGQEINGNQPISVFEQIIDQALEQVE